MSEFCPENTVSPNAHSWTHSPRSGRRWCAECGEAAPKAVRVNNRDQLREVAALLGVRPDWHEPDEQEVTAKVFGQSFDNAGFWPFDPNLPEDRCTGSLTSEALEMYVELYRDGLPLATINLATLLAMACGGIE